MNKPSPTNPYAVVAEHEYNGTTRYLMITATAMFLNMIMNGMSEDRLTGEMYWFLGGFDREYCYICIPTA